MAIILKANKVNLFVSSVLFAFWYHSPNILDIPRMLYYLSKVCCISHPSLYTLTIFGERYDLIDNQILVILARRVCIVICSGVSKDSRFGNGWMSAAGAG
jgi:hypothetical protein